MGEFAGDGGGKTMSDDLYDEISKVAYELHEKRGWQHGHDLEDWMEAERIVLLRYENGGEKGGAAKALKASMIKGK
jgi:hypothetical protein